MAAPLHLEKLPKSLELVFSDDHAKLRYLDQRYLPNECRMVETEDWHDVCDAIAVLGVRGAPAIGIAGASAIAMWVENQAVIIDDNDFSEALQLVANDVIAVRPTAVNLKWAVDRTVAYALDLLDNGCPFEQMGSKVCSFVQELAANDESCNRAIGAAGAAVIPGDAKILTHCNAGSLATYFYGTALGVIYCAAEQGKVQRVYADETRPLGQGARLTVWELAQVGIPTTLICDNMAASLMAKGEIDCVVVGADRITSNGDTANKIGTYGVAILAKHHGIPFYVAAPSSTFDFALKTGNEIPIEQRAACEVLPEPIAGVDIYNPAFDVTPAELITAIITEKGVFAPSELSKLKELL